jgi:hypothetical protein
MNLKLKLLATGVLLSLLGCSEAPSQDLLLSAEKTTLEVIIPAKGELYSDSETKIMVPRGSSMARGPKAIAWLAPEFSQIKKGDVIVRFDGTLMAQEVASTELTLEKFEQDKLKSVVENKQKKDAISHDLSMVGRDLAFNEQFNINDERVRSKLEILESMQNVEYLGSKQDYLNWQGGSFEQTASGELNLIELKRGEHATKLKGLQENLNMLEVVAPHDGLLTYQKNFFGEKPNIGKMMWGGQAIAALPDLSKMKAKLWVREREAIDIKQGQQVVFRLVSAPEQEYIGTVESIAAVAASKNANEVQKYFEVVAGFEQQTGFTPGLKLEAVIKVASLNDVISIPNHLVSSEHDGDYVWLKTTSGLEKRKVSLGQASLSHVEITQGITAGEQISLVNEQG